MATFDFTKIDTMTYKVSLGIISGYVVYVGGYIVTQIMTPLTYGQFYVANILSMLPQYFARGLPTIFIGGLLAPIMLTIPLKSINLNIQKSWYYPTSLGLSALCWIIVLGNFIIA
jgi:hypothetical protein